MDLFEFRACYDGYMQAHDPRPEPPTDEEFDALVEKYKHLDT